MDPQISPAPTDEEAVAIAAAVAALSPVIIATLSPSACNALIASGVVSLIGSATAITAAELIDL